jgi:hypothetical protein
MFMASSIEGGHGLKADTLQKREFVLQPEKPCHRLGIAERPTSGAKEGV